MAKIGVITFHDTLDNYGQVLQYLATQVFLESLGHEVYLLNIQGRFSNKILRMALLIYHKIRNRKKKNVIKGVEVEKSELFTKWKMVTIRKEQENPRFFCTFRDKYFNFFTGSFNDIISSRFDVLCVGSDQIWSYISSLVMFGWAPPSIKKISIAPTIGYKDHGIDAIKQASSYLKDYSFVTVRDEKTYNFCRNCGRSDAVRVLDPIFLLRPEQYNEYSSMTNNHRPYVFVYLLGADIPVSINEIVDFSNRCNLDVKYVESQGRDDDYPSIPAPIEEWLGIMKKSRFVITNSFHGMAFSILFNKQFLVLPITGVMEGMNCRIQDLAATMNLEDRIFHGSFDAIFNPIDWKRTNLEIDRNRRTMVSLLKEAGL